MEQKLNQSQMETNQEKDTENNARLTTAPQHVLYAQTPKGTALGIVSDSEPSSLSLLAARLAGMTARRARRERAKQYSI